MLFSTATLTFLRGLKRHNDRAWFEAHRPEFEAVVQQPMRQLIEELDVRLARLAPEIIGDPKRSLFRIYRDIRFSGDKSPYKTHAACWFYHRDGSRAVGREAAGGGAGFYFQIAPGDSFLGGGMWMPQREALRALREAIARDLKRFSKIATDRRVLRRFGGLSEEAVLRRAPRPARPRPSARASPPRPPAGRIRRAGARVARPTRRRRPPTRSSCDCGRATWLLRAGLRSRASSSRSGGGRGRRSLCRPVLPSGTPR